jgi:hypothetical protein
MGIPEVESERVLRESLSEAPLKQIILMPDRAIEYFAVLYLMDSAAWHLPQGTMKNLAET